MFNVLTISRNTRLLLARNDTLALAGFRVVSPRIPEEAPHLAQQQEVDAVIMGHSVEPEIRGMLIEAIRCVCPRCAVLFVYTGEPQVEWSADVSLDVSKGNEPIITYLESQLRRPSVSN